MTARRLTAALTERSRHTGSSGDAAAASRSRAKSASAGVWESRLRAWRSRTSSGASSRTAPGCGPWVSRQSRLEKPVLSVVGPCRTMPMVRPSESSMAASIGMARYQRKRMG